MEKNWGVRSSEVSKWVGCLLAGSMAITAPSLFAQADGAAHGRADSHARSAKLPPKQAEAPSLRTKPDIRLSNRMKAKDAVKELKRQGKFEDLAKFHQRTPRELEDLMNSQDDMYIDKDGSLLFIDMDADASGDKRDEARCTHDSGSG